MPDEVLLTTLQISDLHFGDVPQGASGQQLSAALPGVLRYSSLFDGWLGHHWRGMSDLHRFYSGLWNDTEGRVRVEVSGDLTACGSVSQFDLASDFLGVSGQSSLPFGLGLVDWHEQAIPGNHDQWPGSNAVLGQPTPGLGRTLPGPYPWIGPLEPLDDTVSIRFLYIDSDADVSPFSRNRLYARGDFVSQLVQLGRDLPDRQEGEIRVLVVHHAIGSIGDPWVQRAAAFPRPASGTRKRLEIDRGCLRVLEHALVDLRIHVVFSGHLHVPRLSEFVASNDVETAQVLEARCGTTTQYDFYPPEVLKHLPYRRVLPPNSLIFHELVRRSDDLVWRARIFWRSRSSGFVHNPRHVSQLLPPSLERELVLDV